MPSSQNVFIQRVHSTATQISAAFNGQSIPSTHPVQPPILHRVCRELENNTIARSLARHMRNVSDCACALCAPNCALLAFVFLLFVAQLESVAQTLACRWTDASPVRRTRAIVFCSSRAAVARTKIKRRTTEIATAKITIMTLFVFLFAPVSQWRRWRRWQPDSKSNTAVSRTPIDGVGLGGRRVVAGESV